MNISTLAKILGVSISDLRDVGSKEGIYGFSGRNTRIPYKSAQEITKVLKPDKLSTLENDDKIYLPSSLTVQEFSDSIGKPPGVVVKTLLMNGVMATLNEKIDYDTAQLISEELGVEVHPDKNFNTEGGDTTNTETSLTKTFQLDETGEGNVITRPPVVTVMGHVDHGKTTLLDTIRKANVAGGEAGAITQHISSYQIEYNSNKITFVDTPGHEAFTAMRARGTQLADFIILMVSAVEGPKPQTVEVIERAKLSKTPVIVAINKIDLPNADVDKTKTDVAGFGLVPEEWGGDTPYIPISAKNNQNIDALLDTIQLFAEVAELKGRVDTQGQAVVIESYSDEKLGVLANILVTQGSLKVGDAITCGVQAGKIKRMNSSDGSVVQEAVLAEPVQIMGLSSVADDGELITVHSTVKEAQKLADEHKQEVSQRRTFQATNSNTGSDSDEINLVLVADVSGSLEALKEALVKIPQEHAQIVIKSESVGQVTESDIEFAEVSGSTIVAFHTDILKNAQRALKTNPVKIVQSDVIYEILNWVEEEILKHVKHEVRIEVLGKAEVLKLFKGPKPNIQVLGCKVTEGKIFSNKPIRVWRGEDEIGRLEINELQRNMAATNEVNISQEFGVSVLGKIKVKEGDIIESIDEVVIT